MRSLIAAALVTWASVATTTVLEAQGAGAVAVTGHVSSVTGPLRGALVRIEQLDRRTVTDADGYFSLIVPSTDVRGQAVTLTASLNHFESKSVAITLGGIPINLDFVLSSPEPGKPGPGAGAQSSSKGPSTSRARPPRIHVAGSDTTPFIDVAGPTDLPSALSGRFVGVDVTPASILGGSTPVLIRGPRSILGSNEPLFVLDGIVLDNTDFSAATQRFGLGGFDYGSNIQDVSLQDIASVQVLRGPSAALTFGSGAANGVIVVKTKDGSDVSGWSVSATQLESFEAPTRLPSFQNLYGQGLDGAFSFFNGRGGGVNDGVAQSWGPPLDGRPLPQASMTQAGQPAVQLWLPHPSSVHDYFNSERTLSTNGAVQRSDSQWTFRLSFDDRDTRGLMPDQSLKRDGVTFDAADALTARFRASVNASYTDTKNNGSPGTGFDAGNPIAELTVMPRQVDADALRSDLRDASGAQISWNYDGQNNPYFSALANSNSSDRTHTTGGGSASFAITPQVSVAGQIGTDYSEDARYFHIASGWMGGFPFYAAPGNFSGGGDEHDHISVQRTTSDLHVDATPQIGSGARLTLKAGGEIRTVGNHIESSGIDSVADLPSAGAPDSASPPPTAVWLAHSRTNAAYAAAVLSSAVDASFLAAGLRNEWTSIVAGQHQSTLYPAIDGTWDVGHALPSLRTGAHLDSMTLRAGWSQAGSDLTPYSIGTMYTGGQLIGNVAPSPVTEILASAKLEPEVTSSWQVGTDLTWAASRVVAGITYYNDRTSNVILGVPSSNPSVHQLTATNAGVVSNEGVEARLAAAIVNDPNGFGWAIAANVAANTNRVEQLYGRVASVPLGPSMWGLTVEAKSGSPMGALVGDRFLRSPSSGQLLLRNGLPLPDSVAGPKVLGSGLPRSVFGLTNSFRFGRFDLSLLVDSHLGGSVFSATNLWGDYSGTLEATAYRPDTGLLIKGIDVATGGQNNQHVSTQDYYHALGEIPEQWVYSASYVKLREARLSFTLPVDFLDALPFRSARVSLIGRNLFTWSKAPNIDPEVALNTSTYGGVEMGQLAAARSLGFQVTIVP